MAGGPTQRQVHANTRGNALKLRVQTACPVESDVSRLRHVILKNSAEASAKYLNISFLKLLVLIVKHTFIIHK